MDVDQLGRPIVRDYFGRRVMDIELNEQLAAAKRAKEYREAVERGEIKEDPAGVKLREGIEARARRDARFQELSDTYDAKVEAEQERARREKQQREEEEERRDPILAEARRRLRVEAKVRELQGGASETHVHVDTQGQAFVIDSAAVAAQRAKLLDMV
jgi:hypothetical protein